MWPTLAVNTAVIAHAERAAGLDVVQDQGVTNAVDRISKGPLVTALTVEMLPAKSQNIAWMESSTKETRFAVNRNAELVVEPVVQVDLVDLLLVAVQALTLSAQVSTTPHVIFLGPQHLNYRIVTKKFEETFHFRSFFLLSTNSTNTCSLPNT